MPNKMLIDATHPEETRVVVLRGQRVEEFDFESANRRQLRGNIYLAKVTRVEPSLQAAFIDYGGNRHGFLAFSEIHPDYYQIPVADRQALIAEEERAQRAAEAEADRRVARRQRASERADQAIKRAPAETTDEIDLEPEAHAMAAASEDVVPLADAIEGQHDQAVDLESEARVASQVEEQVPSTSALPIELDQLQSTSAVEQLPSEDRHPVAAESDEAFSQAAAPIAPNHESEGAPENNITEVNGGESEEEGVVESVGGADALEEVPERTTRVRRQYKIQEVIKRRQIMLVQVVKEERGTKGAALTTYLSLAGRYSVLMPNTARGGGISRKITSIEDRRRLKEIAQELEVPEGMGVILRTAGASRTKTEVKRDFEYLLRVWETVRDLTLKSTAAKLVYEEGSLVKRSLRDLYSKDIDEVLVAGEQAYHEAKEFMRMLMPSHANNVKLYTDSLPIFTRHGIESQLDAMFTPVMQLRSGGYIVINQAEALVAIDVNSGRATREHHIEDTALKTNLEAAEEIARQLRLRDLAGLIVIDFIDMDEKRNNRAVERRLKECLRHDRARIQVGHISHFGLLEMSRQRIRSSVLESSTEKCAHCGGTGHVRSVSSVALQLLRSIEEMLLKGATHNLIARTRSEVALYLLNYKRAHLRSLEERFRIAITVNADSSVPGQLPFVIERSEQVHSIEQAKALLSQGPSVTPAQPEPEYDEETVDSEPTAESDQAVADSEAEALHDDESETAFLDEQGQGQELGAEQPGRRRRRRRRGRRGGDSRAESQDGVGEGQEVSAEAQEDGSIAEELETREEEIASHPDSAEGETDHERRRRRRGRRGGKRNRREHESESVSAPLTTPEAEPEPSSKSYAEPAAAISDVETGSPAQTASAYSDAEQVSVGQHSEAAEALVAPEPPRRRSTIREPAPTGLPADTNGPTAVPPVQTAVEPVLSMREGADSAEQPRRSGWWSKRFGRG